MFHSSHHFKNLVLIFFYRISSAIAQSSQPQDWPRGTLVTASTTHPQLNGRVFAPDKAIDKDVGSYWNDDTKEGASPAPYPDILKLNLGSVVTLDGLVLLSINNAWPLNYTVDTSIDGASWTLAATVELSSAVLRVVRFDKSPLSLKQLRVNITATLGGYSRIAELSPIYAAASSNSTSDNFSTSTPSSTMTPPPSPLSETKSNTVGIIGGVLGGVAGTLLGALCYSLWLLRRKRNEIDTAMVKGMGDGIDVVHTHQIPVNNYTGHTNITNELGSLYLPEAGGYSRNELE